MAEWKIRRRHRHCSRCDCGFEEGARHVSLLRIDGEDVLREDLCRPCWTVENQEDVLFWWVTRFRGDRKKSLQLDLASLERLFMELGGRKEESLRELRYLLCLLLMRKRKVKLIRVVRDRKGERLLLRRPRRTEELEVWVFDFTPEKIEELRRRLQEVLEGAGAESAEETDGSAGEEREEPIPEVSDPAP